MTVLGVILAGSSFDKTLGPVQNQLAVGGMVLGLAMAGIGVLLGKRSNILVCTRCDDVVQSKVSQSMDEPNSASSKQALPQIICKVCDRGNMVPTRLYRLGTFGSFCSTISCIAIFLLVIAVATLLGVTGIPPLMGFLVTGPLVVIFLMSLLLGIKKSVLQCSFCSAVVQTS